MCILLGSLSLIAPVGWPVFQGLWDVPVLSCCGRNSFTP